MFTIPSQFGGLWHCYTHVRGIILLGLHSICLYGIILGYSDIMEYHDIPGWVSSTKWFPLENWDAFCKSPRKPPALAPAVHSPHDLAGTSARLGTSRDPQMDRGNLPGSRRGKFRSTLWESYMIIKHHHFLMGKFTSPYSIAMSNYQRVCHVFQNNFLWFSGVMCMACVHFWKHPILQTHKMWHTDSRPCGYG